MASRKENLKSLFSNTRTRVIIVFTAILLILTVVIGYVKLKGASEGPFSSSSLPQGPVGIQSIPGVMDPTAQYAKLQQLQNVDQAESAQKTGASAIPTIIRTQALGQGVGVIGSKNGESGIGFAALSREEQQGPQNSLWIQTLKNGSCSKSAVTQVVNQGAQLSDLKSGCSCIQLKDIGYTLKDLDHICQCKELRAAGYNSRQLKDAGYTTERLRNCGFDACELRNAGFTAQQMKDGSFSDGELKGAGFSNLEIAKATGLPRGTTAADVLKAGCGEAGLDKLHKEKVSAAAIRRISGCSPEQLKTRFNAEELHNAGFSAADLKRAGFSPEQLKTAGYSASDLSNVAKNADCNVASLKKARAAGVSATTIKQTRGCSTAALKAAGYTAKELNAAGFTAADLKGAGFGPEELNEAGFSAKELKDTGFNAHELKEAGYSENELHDAGFPETQPHAAAVPPQNTTLTGLQNPVSQQNAGNLNAMPAFPGSIPPNQGPSSLAAANNEQLQAILNKQNQLQSEQKYQQKIQQRTAQMLSAATQSIQHWKQISTQVYTEGDDKEVSKEGVSVAGEQATTVTDQSTTVINSQSRSVIKTGDILFAVIDTSINSDEPGPILATIVSGRLKGTKLIGSFNLPSTADKMVITFNTMSVPGASRTITISAYAIDANTARTALSSRTDHHFLMRYGSLFASSFLQGFGNAFQSANTTITIGGTGGGNNVTVSNGVGRSALENAVIGLAQVGQNWSQQAQLLFNTPTTVEVYSGTGIGVLFTQDVQSL